MSVLWSKYELLFAFWQWASLTLIVSGLIQSCWISYSYCYQEEKDELRIWYGLLSSRAAAFTFFLGALSSTLECEFGCLYRDSIKFDFVRLDGLGIGSERYPYWACIARIAFFYLLLIALSFGRTYGGKFRVVRQKQGRKNPNERKQDKNHLSYVAFFFF